MRIEIQRGSETITIGDKPVKNDLCYSCFIRDASVVDGLCFDCSEMQDFEDQEIED